MRAIIHRPPDGKEERFLAESDVMEQLNFAHNMIRLNAEYAKNVAELAAIWEAYRKDPQNLKLFCSLSARIQALSQITLLAAQ